MFPEKIRKKIYRLRVPTGFLGAILILIVARPSLLTIIVGAIISLFGFSLRAWASGHIEKEKNLTISGPYQFTRNPLYLGNFILGISLSISSNSWLGILIFLIYFVTFYPVAIAREVEKMKQLFPEEYKKYQSKVPTFFPNLKISLGLGNKKFSGKLYLKNKEYRALLGGLVIWAILLLKYFLLS
ncbi:MAG: methyltransferase family protein [Candidatus Aminicenantia bacterium]